MPAPSLSALPGSIQPDRQVGHHDNDSGDSTLKIKQLSCITQSTAHNVIPHPSSPARLGSARLCPGILQHGNTLINFSVTVRFASRRMCVFTDDRITPK